MEDLNKLNTFLEELELIQDDGIRRYAEAAIQEIPDYFFNVAASSTGKYHPSYALGDGGLVRHTKAAVRILVELARLEMFQCSDEEIDLMIVVLILHDSFKHGLKYTKYSVADHPVVAAKYFKHCKAVKGIITEEQERVILESMLSHMGSWNTDYKTKKEIMPKPKSKLQRLVHMADYLASRKCLEFNFDIGVKR